MINFNQQQFVKTLANMGFEVFDNSTEAVDSQSAYCNTENGTFQITVVDKWVVFHKPNGTTKDYWGSTAQILAYVRQTLKANGGVVEAPEPEVEEKEEEEHGTEQWRVTFADTMEGAEVLGVCGIWDSREYAERFYEDGTFGQDDKWLRLEVSHDGGETWTVVSWTMNGTPEDDPEWVSEENVRRIVAEATEAYPGLVRKDLDAINEGWDAFKYPESGYLYQHCLNVLESGMPTSWPKSGESYDEAMDWLADATYSALCPEETAGDGPRFADLTPGQLDYIENAGIGDLFVTGEQVARVTDELGLRDEGRDGLTTIRNSVVRHLSDLATEAREAGDWGAFDRYHNNMSGICAVIDHRLMA